MSIQSFIPTISNLPKTREKFATWLTPEGVKRFAELPITGQVGFVIAFVNRHNLAVNAYIDRYDVFLIDNAKLTEQQVHGMVTLDLLYIVEDMYYLTYGYIERQEPTTVFNNLITGLTEALNYIETYEF